MERHVDQRISIYNRSRGGRDEDASPPKGRGGGRHVGSALVEVFIDIAVDRVEGWAGAPDEEVVVCDVDCRRRVRNSELGHAAFLNHHDVCLGRYPQRRKLGNSVLFEQQLFYLYCVS